MTPNEINQRPNYFAGQYLLEDDFELEQKYHIDRQQRHNRLLHVSGIAEGLMVTPVQEGSLKVKVSPGTVVDKQGQQILLVEERSVDLQGNGEKTLFIRYATKEDSPQEGTTSGYRRIVEEPAIDFNDSKNSIALAKLTVADGKITKIDESVRQYSGVRLPGAENSEVTLRYVGDKDSKLAVIDGNLSVTNGTLTVSKATQLNNTLTVKENTTLQKDLTVNGSLKVTGESTLTGNVTANGSLTVSKATQLNNTLTVQENTNLQKDLNVSGNLNVTGTSTLTGNVTANGSLTVSKVTQLNNTLTVQENTNLQKDLNVSGNLNVIGTSPLRGNITANGSLAVTGNVGIGTIEPDRPLTIKGTGSNYELISFQKIENDVAKTKWYWNLQNNGLNLTETGIRLNSYQTGISDGRLYIKEGGNVGIGTTEPGLSKLKIAQSASDFVDFEFYNSGMGQLQVIGWSEGWNINTKINGKHLYLNRDAGENSDVYIGRKGKELFIRGKDGNVGIGTSAPTAKLEVSGNLNVTGTSTLTGDLFVNDNLTVEKKTIIKHGLKLENDEWLDATKIDINYYGYTNDGVLRISSKNEKRWKIVAEHTGGGGEGNLLIFPEGEATERGQWLSREKATWNQYSDQVLKQDVVKLQGILEKAMKLNPVSFVWKNNQVPDIGFIAQEVEQIFPEIVSTCSATGRELKGISYSQFNVIAITAIQEMKIQLDGEISKLKALVEQIKAKNT